MVRMTVTRWSPDTCKCVLEYEWDRDLPESSRVHNFANLVKKCPEHGAIPVAKDLYDKVLLENNTKNKVFAELEKERPGINPSTDFDWVFDSDRKLSVFAKGMSAGALARIRTRFPEVALSVKD